jgi:hypothetical protein
MTPLVPELEAFPVRGIFDGELIPFVDGEPDFLALTTACCSAAATQRLRWSCSTS